MSPPDQLGVGALQLLAEEQMVSVMRGLAAGALRPAQLERRLPEVGHSMVMRRLRRLLDRGLVSYERQRGVPPRACKPGVSHQARYDLTKPGRMLLEIAAEAARWEQMWRSPAERRGRPAGTPAIKLSADRHMRKITLLLADGPLGSRDLDERAPDLCRSALLRRLRELVLAGLLEQRRRGAVPLYELTIAARHLSRIAMLAGRWERRWSRPARPAPGSDLNDLLRMLAPVARVPEPMAGICRLRVDTGSAFEPDIFLAARGGGVLALAGEPASRPEAVGHAPPEAWCDALLMREGPITMSGNLALLSAVIGALSAVLMA
jgi:DNA-binding HxlR family transcriptional regulator